MDSKTISELVEECMADEATVKYLARTSRKQYRWNLRTFAKWMCPEATVDCITKRTRPDFLAHITLPQEEGGRGSSASSAGEFNASLIFFYRWLTENPLDEGRVETAKYMEALPNDHKYVKLPKPRKPDRPSTTPEMALAMLKAAQNVGSEYHRALLWAIITMFNDIPLRKMELLNLELADINQDKWTVHIRHGKGDKERTNFLSKAGIQALKAYLAVRKEGAPALWVHPTHKSRTASGKSVPRHVGERWLYDQIRALAEAAGIVESKRVKPHAFRRGTSRRLYLAGVNIPALMLMLGHSSAGTTWLYIEGDDDELEAVRDIAPLFPAEPADPPAPPPPPTSEPAPVQPLPPAPLSTPIGTPPPPDLLQKRRNNDWRNRSFDRA